MPSRATTRTSGSSRRSRANCCSFDRGRSPHGSGTRCSGSSSPSTWRTSADWLPGPQHGVAVDELLAQRARRRAGRARRCRCRRAARRAASTVGGRHLDRGPPGRPLERRAPAQALVLHRLEPELGRLDAQRGVVRHDDGAAVDGLPERRGEDAVVVLGRVEAVLADLVEVEAVRLDAQRAAVGQRHRLADVAAVGDAQLLDGADHRPGRPPDVVHPALVLVELLDDHQRDHRVGVREGRDRVRIRDEHRRVEHHPRGGGGLGRAGARLVGEQISQVGLQEVVDGDGAVHG